MKNCYYTILIRPHKCFTWTPVPQEAFDDPKGNFFASFAHATKAMHQLARTMPPVWLAGLKRWTWHELTVGYVMVADTPDIASSPQPSPNLKPPR